MADGAQIQSIESLRELRASFWKFKETAQAAIGDAEGDMSRTLMWLEGEQTTYWSGQIRKRETIMNQCLDKLREKRLFRDASGRPPSAVDEEKAFRIAQRRFQEAQDKLATVKKYIRVMHKAIHDYKGSVQGFTTAITQDVPMAVARLDKLSSLLRQYVELAPTSAGGPEEVGATTLASAGGDAAMGRQGGGPVEAPAGDDLPDFPTFDPPAVVLVHTHRPTGLVLAEDGKTPAGDGDQYRRFASAEEALAYATDVLANNAELELAAYNADRSRVWVLPEAEK